MRRRATGSPPRSAEGGVPGHTGLAFGTLGAAQRQVELTIEG